MESKDLAAGGHASLAGGDDDQLATAVADAPRVASCLYGNGPEAVRYGQPADRATAARPAASAPTDAQSPPEADGRSGGGEGEAPAPRTTIGDLDETWTMFWLRVFHAWVFSVACVVTAGTGLNRLLFMAVQFADGLTRAHRVLEAAEVWMRVVRLGTGAALFVLLYAGLLQRGFWLLFDCFSRDMFLNYRRTLCFEGVGPGSFGKSWCRVTVGTEEERHSLCGAMDEGRLLRNTRVGDVLLLKDSHLLQEAEAGPAHVLEVVLPARLTFLTNVRTVALSGTDEWGRLRALWDLICQWLIFLSLDLVPVLVFTLRAKLTFFDLLNALIEGMTVSIRMASCHIIIYFVFSTAKDYHLKFEALRRHADLWACALRLNASAAAVAEPGEEDADAGASDGQEGCAPVVSGTARQAGRPAARQPLLLAQDVGAALEADDPETGEWADGLNACVCLGRLLSESRPRLQLLLLLSCLAGTAACVGAALTEGHEFLVKLSVLIAGGCLLLLLWACPCRSRKGFQGLAQLRAQLQAPSHTPYGFWAQCFERHCGVERVHEGFLNLCLLALAGLGIWLGVAQRVPGCVVVGAVLALWATFVMVVSCCWSEHLWILILVQALMFATGALLLSSHPSPPFTVVLLVGTQLGLWRRSSTHSFLVSKLFFVVVASVTMGIAVAASVGEDGAVFGRPPLEFCSEEDAAAGKCRNFEFPLDGLGSGHAYGFCGLSWPMGPASPGAAEPLGTVSDRCADRHLSIVDFAQFASIAGYLPNETKVNMVLARYLPGWKIEYSQIYNVSNGNHTTFVHLVRGATSIIAVRGTSSAVEVLEDLNFWMPIGFLQLARLIGPSLFNNRRVLETLVHFDPKHSSRACAVNDLLNYVERLKKGPLKNHTIYITGHSLGGGLATAVGAASDIAAVTFSAPGLKATSSILLPKPPDQALIRRSVNVVPSEDLVPQVDQQTGTVLRIRCPGSNPGSCHRLSVTMCELLASCGDGGGHGVPRGYDRKCELCRRAGQNVTGLCPAAGAKRPDPRATPCGKEAAVAGQAGRRGPHL